MLIPIAQILYGLVFLSMCLMSAFIVFHIIFYSYSVVSKLIMLLVFIPVTGVLLSTNFILFASLPLAKIFSGILPL